MIRRMQRSVFVMFMMLGVFIAACRGTEADSWDNLDTEHAGNDMTDIKITVGGQEFRAKFYSNEMAGTIISEMPFDLEMHEYAAQEKVAELNFEIPAASVETPAVIHAGDMFLWSGSSLVLFYTTFSNAYSYVPVGYIEDTAGLTAALGDGSVTVTFEMYE